MLSIPLLSVDMRENRKKWFLYTGILCLLTLLFVVTFYPSGGSRMEAVLHFFPAGLIRGLGMELHDRSLVGVLGTYLYGFWFLLLPMSYTIQISYRLVAAGMEKGNMVYYVGSPLGRKTVIFTQGYFLAFSQFCMISLSTALGIGLSELFFPGSLEIPQFLLLNISVFCVHFAMGGLEYFLSCTGLKKKLQLSLMIGIPVLSLLFHLLGALGDGLEAFGDASIFSVVDLEHIFAGDVILFVQLPLLLIFGVVYYSLAVFVFQKRNLRFGVSAG